jgi:hypothetical protein
VHGFTKDVQQEISPRSESDLNRVVGLAQEACDGLFNIKTCRDGFCFAMDQQTKEAVRTSIVDGRLSVSTLIMST